MSRKQTMCLISGSVPVLSFSGMKSVCLFTKRCASFCAVTVDERRLKDMTVHHGYATHVNSGQY